MTYFILQTLFWLLAAFVIGLILGRWIKRLLCKQPKAMTHGTTTGEEKTSGVSYTNSADKLALRSAKDDPTPSQPTETVARKADSSISAGTAALGATAAGIAGHVASQALTDDKDTEIVEETVESKTIEEVDLEVTEKIEETTESLDVDTTTLNETVETAEVNKEMISNVIEDNVENVIEETAGEVVDEDGSSVKDLLSKGVAAAGVATAGLAIAGKDDIDENLNEDADSGIKESIQEPADAGLESVEKSSGTNVEKSIENIEESIAIDTPTLEKTSKIVDAEIPDTTIEDKIENKLENKVETVVDNSDESPVEDLLSKGVATAGTATAGVAGLAMTGDDEDEITTDVSVSADDDSTNNLETDTQEIEELATEAADTDTEKSINAPIDAPSLEETTETVDTEVTENAENAFKETSTLGEEAESDDETLSGAITEKIEDKVDDNTVNAVNTDDSSAGNLLSKGVTAAGLATASDGTESVGEGANSNSYLDSIVAEGASVIAGIESSKLRVIEGIGKKMEAILHENDINTWKDLSMKSDVEIRDILDQHGDKYKGVELEGWIEQAVLLANGKVEELISLQKQDGVASQLEDWLKHT